MSSCSDCKPTIKYVNKPYRVNVPTKCVVPNSNCSFKKDTDTEVISAMLECIVEIKRNEEVCK